MKTRPVAVFDIDGTIFRSSLFIELVYALIERGVFPAGTRKEVERAERVWREREKVGAYDEYAMAVVRVQERHLPGVEASVVRSISRELVNHLHRHTYVYTRELIEKLRPTHVLIAISGSPREMVEEFCKKWGFEHMIASDYAIKNGRYTGEVTLANTNKSAILKRLATRHSLSLAGSLAVGDSKGDIDLLDNAARPIAFNPDHLLKEAALTHGWRIVVERKSQIYELESRDGTFVLATAKR